MLISFLPIRFQKHLNRKKNGVKQPVAETIRKDLTEFIRECIIIINREKENGTLTDAVEKEVIELLSLTCGYLLKNDAELKKEVRDADMLEAGYIDLYNQNFQRCYEIGLTEAVIGMLVRMIKFAKMSMSEEKWKAYRKNKEKNYKKCRKENTGCEETHGNFFDENGNLVKEKWIEEMRIIMTCMDFPKDGWDDICAFIKKYPGLSPMVLARRIVRESEYKYI